MIIPGTIVPIRPRTCYIPGNVARCDWIGMMNCRPDALTVKDRAPTDTRITSYDQAHFLTYARIQDAVAAELDWRDGAREILLLDPDTEGAWLCWASHVERAQWISTVGFELAFREAGLIETQ